MNSSSSPQCGRKLQEDEVSEPNKKCKVVHKSALTKTRPDIQQQHGQAEKRQKLKKMLRIKSDEYIYFVHPKKNSPPITTETGTTRAKNKTLLYARLADGSVGPAVGCIQFEKNDYNDEGNHNVKNVDLDPLGFGGEYVGELLHARPLLVPLMGTDFTQQQRTPKRRRTQLESTAAAAAAATNNNSKPEFEVMQKAAYELATRGLTVIPDAPQLLGAVAPMDQVDLVQLHQTLVHQQGSFFGCTMSHGQPAKVRSDQVRFVTCWGPQQEEEEEENCDDSNHQDGLLTEQLKSTLQWMEQIVKQMLVLANREDGDNNNSHDVDTSNSNSNSTTDKGEQVTCVVFRGGLNDDNRSNTTQGYPVWRPARGMCSLYKASHQAHYTWHVDNELDPQQQRWRNFRVLTAILYLNYRHDKDDAGWEECDGGQLECQLGANHFHTTDHSNKHNDPSAAAPSSMVSIAPAGGTLVVFDSCRIRHRVCPAHRDRFALTQWFVSPHFFWWNDTDHWMTTAPTGYRQWQQEKQEISKTGNHHHHHPKKNPKKNPDAETIPSDCKAAPTLLPPQSASFCHWPSRATTTTAAADGSVSTIRNEQSTREVPQESVILRDDDDDDRNNTNATSAFSFGFVITSPDDGIDTV